MTNVLSISAVICLLTSFMTLLCCFYLKFYQNAAKRFILYTMFADVLLSLGYLGRFSDWNDVPHPGFWCQWSGILTVIGANSRTLWIFVTATYIILLIFHKRPGRRFEILFIILWPMVTVLPAVVPLAFMHPDHIYGPSITGQCFYIQASFIVYIMVIWVGILLVYILLSYTIAACYVYYISKQVERTIQDKIRMKQVVNLAASPIIYWFLYIWIIVLRILQLVLGSTPLAFERYAVALTIWIGFVNSVWFGYSRDIYLNTYKNIFGEKEKSIQYQSLN